MDEDEPGAVDARSIYIGNVSQVSRIPCLQARVMLTARSTMVQRQKRFKDISKLAER
jgi:hypothetical protein